MWKVVGVVVFVLGCEHVSLTVTDKIVTARDDTFVVVSAHVFVQIESEDNWPCADPPAAMGAYGGLPAQPVGRVISSDKIPGNCPLGLRIELPSGPTTNDTITISGGGFDITAEFPAGLLASRIATPLEEPAFTFQSGTTYHVRWSHPADFATAEPPRVEWVGLGAGGFITWIKPGVPTGDQIAFEAGLPTLAAPSGTLFISGGREAGFANSCDGAADCTYQLTHIFVHPAMSF